MNKVDDELIAGAMEAATDACSRHVVCNEAITAAVEYALAPLQVENERLRAEVDQWKVPLLEWLGKTKWVQQTVEPHELGHHRADIMRLRIQQAEERAERLARDAERYRWLRDYCGWTMTTEDSRVRIRINLPLERPEAFWDAAIDAAIDAAMQPAKGEEAKE